MSSEVGSLYAIFMVVVLFLFSCLVGMRRRARAELEQIERERDALRESMTRALKAQSKPKPKGKSLWN